MFSRSLGSRSTPDYAEGDEPAMVLIEDVGRNQLTNSGVIGAGDTATSARAGWHTWPSGDITKVIDAIYDREP